MNTIAVTCIQEQELSWKIGNHFGWNKTRMIDGVQRWAEYRLLDDMKKVDPLWACGSTHLFHIVEDGPKESDTDTVAKNEKITHWGQLWAVLQLLASKGEIPFGYILIRNT